MNLSPADIRRLRSAEGYIELGMYPEANAELEEITPELRHLSDVSALRVRLYAAMKEWELMQVVAAKLWQDHPEDSQWAISLAYATRRSQCIENARSVLHGALLLHPKDFIIRYNLACYECQMGNLETAKNFLSEALAGMPGARQMAMDDPDLEPLWASLSGNIS